MMILKKNMTQFCVMDASRVPDGQSGYSVEWTDGEEFLACAVLAQGKSAAKDQSKNIADKDGAVPEYTIFTLKSVLLPYHAIVKRKSDGRIFRTLSDPTDGATPDGAYLDLRMHAAELYKLTGTIDNGTGGENGNEQS